jgi:hypothetical protein
MTSTVLAGLLLRQPFQPFRGRLSHPLFNHRRHRLDTSHPSQRPRPLIELERDREAAKLRARGFDGPVQG